MLPQLNIWAKEYEYLIKAIAAFLPLLTTLLMAYIAYQQWQTNERERKQKLFDLRYEHLIVPIVAVLNKLHRRETLSIGNVKEEFYSHYNKYRGLISDYDAEELLATFKTMLVDYEKFHCKEYNLQIYMDRVTYNLQYIEVILYEYLHVERNKVYSPLSIFIQLVSLLRFLLPINLQKKLLKHRRNKLAVQKSALIDTYDINDNSLESKEQTSVKEQDRIQ